ncbi:MAG: preprotein translocase subunit SecG [Prosthecobacter sp.]
MDIFIGILTAVEVIVCLLLILVVLMQRPRQEGLGASFGDAAASQVWGAQTTNVLQKFTVYLAVILFALTLLLAVLVSRTQNGGKTEKIFGDAAPAAAAEAATDEDMKAKLVEQIQNAVKEEADKKAEPAKSKEGAAPKADEKPKAEKKASEAPKAEAKKEQAAAPKSSPPAPTAPAEASKPTPAEQPK